MFNKRLLFTIALTASVGLVALQPKKEYLQIDAYVPKTNFEKNVDYVTLVDLGILNPEYTSIVNYSDTPLSMVQYMRQMPLIFWSSFFGMLSTPEQTYRSNSYTFTNFNRLNDLRGPLWVDIPLEVFISNPNSNQFNTSLVEQQDYDLNDFVHNDAPFMANSFNRMHDTYEDEGFISNPYVPLNSSYRNSWLNFEGFIDDDQLEYSYDIFVYIKFFVDDVDISLTDQYFIDYVSDVWFGTYDYAMYSLMGGDYDDGYDEGYGDGNEHGYYDGYDDGINDGYTDGYADGVADGEATATGGWLGNLVFGTIGGIVGLLFAISDFEVLGVSIMSIITLFVAIGVIILLIKVIK